MTLPRRADTTLHGGSLYAHEGRVLLYFHRGPRTVKSAMANFSPAEARSLAGLLLQSAEEARP